MKPFLIAAGETLGFDSLKEDPIPPFSSDGIGFGWISLFKLLLAVALVILAIRWLLPKYIHRFSKPRTGGEDSELRVLESLPIAGGSLHLVKVREQVLLIGSSPNTISLIANLSEIEELPDLKHSADEEPAENSDRFKEVLARLQRLGG
ncbi:MAG TPA: flagellar biosynthetic protein FliO [Fimbriimonadales bacterium]|nr:flagellar biosynthetic protein FliO [Fimbriimonadales bacterium]